jgi:protein disulfide-isomerase/protein disulfide isomerase family A protein 5
VKLKAGSEVTGVILKHYHNGDFNRDYDRALKVSALVNFMKDPTGDLPWDEDPTATAVVHLQDLPVSPHLINNVI